jgi:1-acyl-sn-glycerol-3-phosphate acyltransferase
MKDHPLPVAVCALDGGYRIATLDGIFRNLRNGYYRIKILKIYPAPQSKEEQMHILEEGKALIQAQLDEWRRE